MGDEVFCALEFAFRIECKTGFEAEVTDVFEYNAERPGDFYVDNGATCGGDVRLPCFHVRQRVVHHEVEFDVWQMLPLANHRRVGPACGIEHAAVEHINMPLRCGRPQGGVLDATPEVVFITRENGRKDAVHTLPSIAVCASVGGPLAEWFGCGRRDFSCIPRGCRRCPGQAGAGDRGRNEMDSKELARRAMEKATNPVDKIEIMARHGLPGIAEILASLVGDESGWFELVPKNCNHRVLFQTAENRDDRLHIVLCYDGKRARLHFAGLAQHLGWDQDVCTAFVDQMLERLEDATAPEVEDDLSWSRGLMVAVCRYCGGADSPYWPLVVYKAVRQVMLEPSHQVFWALEFTPEGFQVGVRAQAKLIPVRVMLEQAKVDTVRVHKLFLDAMELPGRTMTELLALVGACGVNEYEHGPHKGWLVVMLSRYLGRVLREQFGDVEEVHRTNHFVYLLKAGVARGEGSWQVVRQAFVELMATGGEPLAWQYAFLFGKELGISDGMRPDYDRDVFIVSCRQEAIGMATERGSFGVAAALALAAKSEEAWSLIELAVAHGQHIGFKNGYVMMPKGWQP